jgi:hypothetical protein
VPRTGGPSYTGKPTCSVSFMRANLRMKPPIRGFHRSGADACKCGARLQRRRYASTPEDRALSPKSKVSCSILAGRRAFAGERTNESAAPNLGSPTTRLRPSREANLSLEKCLDGVSMRSRTVHALARRRQSDRPRARSRSPGSSTPLAKCGHGRQALADLVVVVDQARGNNHADADEGRL